MPKFVYLLHATKESDSGAMPTTAQLTEMMAYNKALSEANLLLSADGFKPSSTAARITFSSKDETPRSSASSTQVTHGPFDLKNLISGYWVVQAKNLEEAVAWARKAPLWEGSTIEVRGCHGEEDFGEAMTDELKDLEMSLKKDAEARSK